MYKIVSSNFKPTFCTDISVAIAVLKDYQARNPDGLDIEKLDRDEVFVTFGGSVISTMDVVRRGCFSFYPHQYSYLLDALMSAQDRGGWVKIHAGFICYAMPAAEAKELIETIRQDADELERLADAQFSAWCNRSVNNVIRELA